MLAPMAAEFKSKRKFLLAVAVWARAEWRCAHTGFPKPCSWCGQPFRQYRKDHQFCSKRCKQLSYRAQKREGQT